MTKNIIFFLIPIVLISACSSNTLMPQPTETNTGSGSNQPMDTPQTAMPEPVPLISPTATQEEEFEEIPTINNDLFLAPEITGRPTNSSITFNVIPAVEMEISYAYGTESSQYSMQTPPQAATPGVPLETLITGLQPDTRYYYRILYQNKMGVEGSFTTQRATGSTFTFDIQGDSHPERVNKEFNADLYVKTLQSAASDQPDFYLTVGDDFSVDALKSVTPESVYNVYLRQRQWLALVGAPIYLVNGNHEQASIANLNGTAENVAVWAQNDRNSLFPQPAPDTFYSGDQTPIEYIGLLRDYYAFTWGDALFVVIDPYWHSATAVDNTFGAGHDEKKNRDLWQVTLGDEQYLWFKQTLETSTSKYKFVFTHHVLGTGRGGIENAMKFEWGDQAGLAIHREGWEKTIQQIMADNHVTIFFQGHDHIFARQELDGVIYQSLPEPADPNYELRNADSYKSGDLYPNSGHVRVTVSPEGVQVDYVRSWLDLPDEIAFTYTVQ